MTSTSKLFRILDSHFWHDQIFGILRFWHHQIFGTSQFLTWSDFWCSQNLAWPRFLDSQNLTWSDFGHFKFWDHGITIMTPSWHQNFETTVELECWFASRPPPRHPVWRHRGWSRGTHTHPQMHTEAKGAQKHLSQLWILHSKTCLFWSKHTRKHMS